MSRRGTRPPHKRCDQCLDLGFQPVTRRADKAPLHSQMHRRVYCLGPQKPRRLVQIGPQKRQGCNHLCDQHLLLGPVPVGYHHHLGQAQIKQRLHNKLDEERTERILMEVSANK